jgi:prepilin-type N-terminal cleavage/methylation domain-containing protein
MGSWRILMSRQSGFSLIELMFVVGILGVLTAVAAPAYSRFRFRAYQVQAKTELNSLFTAERLFYAEYGEYSSRLDVIGYRPSGVMNYSVSFVEDYGPPSDPSAPQGTAECYYTCQFGTHAPPPGCSYTITWSCSQFASGTGNGGLGVGGQYFIAFAGAYFGAPDFALDTWSIDSNKNLEHPGDGTF